VIVAAVDDAVEAGERRQLVIELFLPGDGPSLSPGRAAARDHGPSALEAVVARPLSLRMESQRDRSRAVLAKHSGLVFVLPV